MKYIKLFFICLIPSGLFAQTAKKLKVNGYTQVNIHRAEYSDKKTEFFIQKKYRKNSKNMYVKFNGDNDSVSIYLNDSLIFSQWTDNLEKSYYRSQFNIPIPFSIKKSDEIIISLNKKKEYILFKVKEKYYSTWVSYKSKGNQWTISQDNNLPME